MSDTRAAGTADAGGLSRSRLIYFGLPDYAVYLAAIPVSLYLPLVYSRDLRLDLADVGLILMLARVSDVITDPLIGSLSDRTNTRIGKRKPWLAGGALVMMISAWQLFAPGGTVTNWHLLIWSMLLYGGAVFVIWRYPLDAERLDRLRAALERRRQRRTARMATDDRRDAVMATRPGPLRRDA